MGARGDITVLGQKPRTAPPKLAKEILTCEQLEELLEEQGRKRRAGREQVQGTPKSLINEVQTALLKLGMKPATVESRIKGALNKGKFTDAGDLLVAAMNEK